MQKNLLSYYAGQGHCTVYFRNIPEYMAHIVDNPIDGEEHELGG